jgi:hypothetical protein
MGDLEETKHRAGDRVVRRREEPLPARPLVVSQEPLDLGAEFRFPAAHLIQQCRSRGMVAPLGRLEDLVDPPATFEIHRNGSPS